MSSAENQRFQVDLGGIISVLSDNLYSSPQVAFRELLQNGLDAITMRRAVDPSWVGRIHVELSGRESNPTVVVEDNGIGLSEDEIHLFLATIGGSAKRGPGSARSEFLGQFGIGLLSCFVLTDELVVITRKAGDPDAPAVEWRGRGDGTYSVRLLAERREAGTRVYLALKPAFAHLVAGDGLRRALANYGEFLPVPIELEGSSRTMPITSQTAPWPTPGRREMDQAALWEAAGRYFGGEFEDIVPISAPAGGLEGYAFVSGEERGLQATPAHRVYLKGMLLSERADRLAPDWAVFVNLLVNTTELRPTASREGLVEDRSLEQTRAQIGECLLGYLRRLALAEPDRLAWLIGRHGLALKSLALQDEEVLRLIGPWFEFETSVGRKRFEEILAMRHVQYATSVDRFRQLAPIASAENRCLVNAGYVFEEELMGAFAAEFPEVELEAVGVAEFGEWFGEVSDETWTKFRPLAEAASEALREMQCTVELREFAPPSLPVLYARNEAADSFQMYRQSQESADGFLSDLLSDLDGRFSSESRHTLYLNAANPMLRRLAEAGGAPQWARVVEVLYVEALLLGRYPISEGETRMLSRGLAGLIELGLRPGDRDALVEFKP